MASAENSANQAEMVERLAPLCFVPGAPRRIVEVLKPFAAATVWWPKGGRNLVAYERLMVVALRRAVSFEITAVRIMGATKLLRLSADEPVWANLRLADLGRWLDVERGHRLVLWERLGAPLFQRLEECVRDYAVRPAYDVLCRQICSVVGYDSETERDERWLALRDSLWRWLNTVLFYFAGHTALGNENENRNLSDLIDCFRLGAVPSCPWKDGRHCWLVLGADEKD